MKNVSYFTHKLGLAIAAKNTELADFYIHEVEEGLEEIYGVSTYDKLPIGDTAKKIMPTAFAALENAIDAKAQEDMTSPIKPSSNLVIGVIMLHNTATSRFWCP